MRRAAISELREARKQATRRRVLDAARSGLHQRGLRLERRCTAGRRRQSAAGGVLLRDCLTGGVARGDVRGDVDVDLAADLIIGAYAWNYRRGATGAADAGGLTTLLDRQLGVIFEGLALR
jgi:hypothetical protein